LVTDAIDQERVITTVPKAKVVKPLVDRMMTLGKDDTLHARREAARIVRLTPRKGDGAAREGRAVEEE
jgi:large subunit ribosomal protein L17